jgi:hypothetical protein
MLVELLLLTLLLSNAVFVAEARGEDYFLVRDDYRKCAFPRCGGYLLKPVNSDSFDCPRGEHAKREECYSVEITSVNKDASVTLVKGKFSEFNEELNSFQATERYEGHRSPHPAAHVDDIFYSVRDMGIVCVTNPCNTFHAVKLNEPGFQRNTLMFAEVDFSKILGEDDDEASIRLELRRNGLIVSAVAYPVLGPAGASMGLRVTNFFTKIPEPLKPCTKSRDCVKGQYCSKESCDSSEGSCQTRPASCEKASSPVCACDGEREFDNDCVRQLFGVTAATKGRCDQVEQ